MALRACLRVNPSQRIAKLMPYRRSRPRQLFVLATVGGLAVAGAVAVEVNSSPAVSTAASTFHQRPVFENYPLDVTPTPTSTRWRRRQPTPTPTPAATTAAPTTSPTGPPPSSTIGGPPASVPNVGVPDGLGLTPRSGGLITRDGTVIDGADISGPLTIDGKNVVIRRSRVRGDGDAGIYVRFGSATVEDVTVEGFDNSIGGDRYTATRVEAVGANEDGFKIGSNVTIQDSWCHDLIAFQGAHSDCGQVQSGVTNVIIRRNWFDSGVEGNSALFISPDQGPSSPGPLSIENNVLGGGNYTLQCVDGDYGRYLIGNITIRGNQFLDNSEYGPMRVNVLLAFLGNVYRSTGLPILL